MQEKAFAEVRIINGPRGVVIGKAGDILLVHVGSGLNSYRIVVSEIQVEGHPDLRDVPELSIGILKSYLI